MACTGTPTSVGHAIFLMKINLVYKLIFYFVIFIIQVASPTVSRAGGLALAMNPQKKGLKPQFFRLRRLNFADISTFSLIQISSESSRSGQNP